MILYTKNEFKQMKSERLNELLDHAGGAGHLGLMTDIHTQVVIGWQQRGQVSLKGARKIGEHPTLGPKFPAEYLRPELETK